MKAYDKGFAAAMFEQNQIRGRAYESDKSNKEYFQGFADGLRKKHPGQMIVKCNTDSTIFAAYPQPMSYPGYVGEAITCPTCARRYIKEENGDYVSDRKLTIL